MRKELADEKAKKGVDNDNVTKRLAEADQKNVVLTVKVAELEKELAEERARGSANKDAKQELAVMKAKLAEMVAGGVKIKVETIE